MRRILAVDPNGPREERVRVAADVLEAGGVVALPTETFYGLAADPFNSSALGKLNELKRKPRGSPALLLLASREQVDRVAVDLPDVFRVLADAFWPGPLTLVVPAAPALPEDVSGGRGTVGLRVPGLALPRHLAAALGRPVTGVSANLHGRPPNRTAKAVVEALGEDLDLILDGGPAPGAAPSTVLDLSSPRPRLIRAGAVPLGSIQPFVEGLDGPAV